VIYYGAAPGGFIPAVELTPRRAQELMPLGVYAPLALVQAFLPATGVLALFPHPAVLTVSGVAVLPALVGQVFIARGRWDVRRPERWSWAHTPPAPHRLRMRRRT
jgi:hypothetical protein